MDVDPSLLAVILGVVQGLTEFLPVSSSGHLIIVSWLMQGKPLPLTINLALHAGTLLAVVAYFWRTWWSLAAATSKRIVSGERSFESDTLLPSLVLGSVPAAILGLSMEDTIERVFHNPATVILPLAALGLILWWVDLRCPSRRELRSLSLKDGVMIGLCQACALIPGVSRSGATLIGGRALGFDRDSAARFSFLLGTPAMGGAALLHAKEFWEYRHDPSLYLGVLVSCLVGFLAIRFFLGFIKRYGFLVFALYRIFLALVIAILLAWRN